MYIRNKNSHSMNAQNIYQLDGRVAVVFLLALLLELTLPKKVD